mmetsp:Transcript_18751/g.30389  ORF Transcript_18751/g.30389 Transcript_18751/m.30389 type:complete len:209 (+) Transcript_18751:577-1203(+)
MISISPSSRHASLIPLSGSIQCAGHTPWPCAPGVPGSWAEMHMRYVPCVSDQVFRPLVVIAPVKYSAVAASCSEVRCNFPSCKNTFSSRHDAVRHAVTSKPATTDVCGPFALPLLSIAFHTFVSNLSPSNSSAHSETKPSWSLQKLFECDFSMRPTFSSVSSSARRRAGLISANFVGLALPCKAVRAKAGDASVKTKLVGMIRMAALR